MCLRSLFRKRATSELTGRDFSIWGACPRPGGRPPDGAFHIREDAVFRAPDNERRVVDVFYKVRHRVTDRSEKGSENVFFPPEVAELPGDRGDEVSGHKAGRMKEPSRQARRGCCAGPPPLSGGACRRRNQTDRKERAGPLSPGIWRRSLQRPAPETRTDKIVRGLCANSSRNMASRSVRYSTSTDPPDSMWLQALPGAGEEIPGTRRSRFLDQARRLANQLSVRSARPLIKTTGSSSACRTAGECGASRLSGIPHTGKASGKSSKGQTKSHRPRKSCTFIWLHTPQSISNGCGL